LPKKLGEICSRDLEALPRSQTVFYFPVGPLEDHGPHLPLGVDLREAEAVCFALATKLEKDLPGWVGVIMPTAPLGSETNTTMLSIYVRPHVLRDWLVDACIALTKRGFKHYTCISGFLGPKQLTTIEEAGKVLSKKFVLRRLFRGLSKTPKINLISASSALIKNENPLKNPMWPNPIEHGAQKDTSICLYLNQNHVDPSYKALPKVERDSSLTAHLIKRILRKKNGYWGDPSKASLEEGKTLVEQKANLLHEKLLPIWRGAKPKSNFRSWYSIFPPNSSFFIAWILFLMFATVLALWAYFAFIKSFI